MKEKKNMLYPYYSQYPTYGAPRETRTSYRSSNENSRLVRRVTKNGKFRTETRYRDAGADRFAVSTDSQNRTKLFVDFDGGELRGGSSVVLNGHQARTLQRLLNKHYGV